MVRILRGNFTMESGLFLDSQVEIWRHNIIWHVCGTGPISESFIYIYKWSSSPDQVKPTTIKLVFFVNEMMTRSTLY
jgi:hypothetical protein